MKHNRKRVFRAKYLNISFLFVQRDFSARQSLLNIPEEGVFIKNSGDSVVCSLFDVTAFSRLVSEKSPHPLTREKLTASMVVSADKCFYDHGKGSFVIKDS
ncbi:TPA: T3SS effector NleG family protein [Escherichia coli]|nr:T3SS effector NleG family protein [Escherichia coli]